MRNTPFQKPEPEDKRTGILKVPLLVLVEFLVKSQKRIFKNFDKVLFTVTLIPVLCIVYKTDQNRSGNGNIESRSFREARAVRNEDSRCKIGGLYLR